MLSFLFRRLSKILLRVVQRCWRAGLNTHKHIERPSLHPFVNISVVKANHVTKFKSKELGGRLLSWRLGGVKIC